MWVESAGSKRKGSGSTNELQRRTRLTAVLLRLVTNQIAVDF